MSLRKSFIARLFSVLFVLTLLILILAGVSIFLFAQQVVGGEFIRLNQTTLRQQAASIGRDLTDLRAYGERISINSRLNELVALPGEDAALKARSLLSDINNEYISSRQNANMLMEVYVLGIGGMSVSANNMQRYTAQQVLADERFAPLLRGETDLLVLPTTFNPEGKGVLIYTYQMAFPMAPVYAVGERELRGLVLFEIGELTLFSSFRGFQQGDVVMNIIDGEGRILSAKNKSNIGSAYDYSPAFLKDVESLGQVTSRIRDGYFYLYERIPGTEWLLVQRMPAATAFQTLNWLLYAILLIIAVFSVFMLTAFVYSARRTLRPVMHIKDKMQQVMEGDLSVRIETERDDEFGHIEGAFNGMVEQISLLIGKVKQEEQEKRLAELDFLQAQINPHFIYNTLTSIRFMLEMGKADEAGEMVFYFSKLLRETLSRSDEFVTLGEELDTLESYVSIQILRYKDAFSVEYDVDACVLTTSIPALLLQPVVENAIFHAGGPKAVLIRITAALREGQLIIRVADNGVGMSSEERRMLLQKDLPINRVGLRNVQERIRLNYGVQYGLTLSETPGGGTTVTFVLPCNPIGPPCAEEEPL